MNKYILGKQKKGKKRVPRAPLVVSDLTSSERGFYHYTSIPSHTLSTCKFMTYSVDNYLARMGVFDGSRSLLTVENRSQLTVIFFD